MASLTDADNQEKLDRTLLIGITTSRSELSQQAIQRLQQAYQRINVQVEFLAVPSERRLRMVLNQQLDGDLFRLCELAESYQELITIPVQLGSLQLNAYALDEHTLQQWQQNKHLIIAYTRGFKMAEQTSFAGNRLAVTDQQQAFGLLRQQRVDIVLEDDESADFFLQQPDLEHGNVFASSTLALYPVCHILHAKHQLLADDLLQELQLDQP